MFRLFMMIIRNLRIIPGAYRKLRRYAKHPNDYSEEKKYRHIQYIFQRAILRGNIDLQVYGLENIPKENGFMLYSNHQGKFDPLPIVATCSKPIGAVLKQELYRIPFIKLLVDCTNSFPMDREDTRQSVKVIQAVIEEIKKGRNYLVFPEGELSRSNQLIDFHSGCFRCAIKTRCPVVPIALIDSFKPFNQKSCKRTQVQIHYLPPIYYEEYKGLNSAGLASLVKARIQQAIDAGLSAENYLDAVG